MGARIAVIDNGICNLRSVTKALEAVGAVPVVVQDPSGLGSAGASGLVLPGVGALRDCVGSLRASGLDGHGIADFHSSTSTVIRTRTGRMFGKGW